MCLVVRRTIKVHAAGLMDPITTYTEQEFKALKPSQRNSHRRQVKMQWLVKQAMYVRSDCKEATQHLLELRRRARPLLAKSPRFLFLVETNEDIEAYASGAQSLEAVLTIVNFVHDDLVIPPAFAKITNGIDDRPLLATTPIQMYHLGGFCCCCYETDRCAVGTMYDANMDEVNDPTKMAWLSPGCCDTCMMFP